MATITVGTNSWVTEAEANTYFDSRVGSSDYWVDGEDDNLAALITAFNWLNAKYDLPVVGTTAIKNAQCEMALFLLQHQPDLDLRMGLQAQGVIAAGVVKERYKGDNTVEMPVPPIVQQLLADYDTDKPVYLINLERNEEEGVSYDAYANLGDDES
uniref:Uncharacterized protein n=1 Tax=viral metagenome TaxID=1070528 RepID=A0A6M3LWZ3_9ZZZZ